MMREGPLSESSSGAQGLATGEGSLNTKIGAPVRQAVENLWRWSVRGMAGEFERSELFRALSKSQWWVKYFEQFPIATR